MLLSVLTQLLTPLRDNNSNDDGATGRAINLSILTQYYPPDFAATGQFVEELAVHLADQGMQVKVFTGQPGYAFDVPNAPETETVKGVFVRRCGRLKTGSRKMVGRTLSSLLFCWRALLYLLNRNHWGDILLFTSEPPYLQTLGYVLNKLFGIPYACIVYDLYPEVAVELKVLSEQHWVTRLWNLINRRVWRRAAAIIVPCQTMEARILAKVPEVAEKISVIHNWADPNWIKPLDKTDNTFAHRHGLVTPFTVLYSGNMGRCHDMETILQTAQHLKDEPVQFVFIGGGPKRPDFEAKAKALNLEKCLFLPYQDKQLLPQSLTACDLSLVSVDIGMEGLVAPSKFYSALATGRPVAVICEKHSYLRQLVAEANCGVAIQNGDSQGLADFIRYLMSDAAMVRRLGLSGHRYIQDCFTPELISKQYGRLLRNAVIQHEDLHQAVTQLVEGTETPQFELCYQPVVSLGTGKMLSVESLLRWQHPDCGLLTSDVFIAAAESTGLIIPLGWWVIEQTCYQLSQWRARFPHQPHLSASINLSGPEFFQPDLVPRLDQILQRYQLPGKSLILEIKDEVAMADPAATTALFLQLRTRQIKVCIDNFGASHSSLSYLHRFPVDVLKIDRSLIQRLDIDPDSLNLIDTIGILSKDLNMVAIATGIETADHLKLLKEIGLTYGQGFIFSEAVPTEQITALLQQERWACLTHTDTPATPAAEIQTTNPDEQPPRPTEVTHHDKASPLVLIIDDDRFMRTLLSKAITGEGYNAIEAATGEAGLLSFQQYQPDVVIVDINLPDIDGLTCCQRLRKMIGDHSDVSSQVADTVPRSCDYSHRSPRGC